MLYLICSLPFKLESKANLPLPLHIRPKKQELFNNSASGGLSPSPDQVHCFAVEFPFITRGHSFKLKKSRFNNDLRQHFFSERIVNIWNALDDDLVCASSLNVFKNGLHLLWKNDRLPMDLLYSTDLWSSEAKPVPLVRPQPGELPVSKTVWLNTAKDHKG